MPKPGEQKNIREVSWSDLVEPLDAALVSYIDGSPEGSEGKRVKEQIEAAQTELQEAASKVAGLFDALNQWLADRAGHPAEGKSITRLEEMAEDVGYSGSDIQGMIDAVYAALPGDSEVLDVIQSVCEEYGYTPPWEKSARPGGRKTDHGADDLATHLEREVEAAERRSAEIERASATRNSRPCTQERAAIRRVPTALLTVESAPKQGVK